MAELALSSAVYGIMGILIGALTGAVVNNRLGAKNKRSEFIFQKKAEYFEKVADSLENNLKLYNNAIEKAQHAQKKEIKEILIKLKNERKNFKISTSPLYLNTTRISKRIIKFVNIEKSTFAQFSKLENTEDIEEKEIKLAKLQFNFKELRRYANEIIHEIRKNMK